MRWPKQEEPTFENTEEVRTKRCNLLLFVNFLKKIILHIHSYHLLFIYLLFVRLSGNHCNATGSDDVKEQFSEL